LAAIMLDLMSALGRRAADALRAAHPNSLDKIPEELTVVRAGKPEFGDLQCSAALQLGKALGQKPRDLAQAIADAMGGHEAVARVEIAGPGFVNVHLADAWMAAAAARGATLRPIGAGQRVVIDYSSPNVAKPMHIGHIRSTIIGEAIKRVLRAVGYEVIGDNHLGDWGTQFGKLIVAYRRWVDRAAFERSPVDELLRLYVKFTDEEKRQQAELAAAGGGEAAQTTEEDDEGTPKPVTPLLAEARAELVKLQAGDPENVALWRQFVDVSMREFDRVYQRLGVSFDVTLGESFYNDRLAATVKLLVDRGIAEESKGAMVVFFTKERDGEELPPFLIRKADGGYNYGTTDVAGVLYRMERWSPTRILIVTDERQQLHFKQLFAVARRLGVKASQEHIWFGLMRLPEGTFSTRDGNVIGLEALLDEAERRALALAQEKNAERAEGGEPALSEAELREVARVVGIGAVKYNDLSKDRQTLVTFTWDKALSLQGNTAPYLQYAYARIRSILRKAEKEAGAQPGAIGALAPAERALASKLLGFDEAVEQVARTTRPHILAEYLFDLSQAFSTFYNECPVLKAEPAVRAGRLTLCAQTAETLRRGLDLLGIEVLERM
jgi:arginyl-tRNA synthetase